MHGHIIVSGDDALATTIVEELNNAGATSSSVTNSGRACRRGSGRRAAPSICAGDDDALNLEIALLARKANPDVRVVARLANDVLREAMAADNGPGAILDVADLAAPVGGRGMPGAHHAHRSRRPASNSSSRDAEAPRDGPCARSTATWPGGGDPRQELPDPGERRRHAPAGTCRCTPATGPR